MDFIDTLGKISLIEEIVVNEEGEGNFEIGAKFLCGLFDHDYKYFIYLSKLSKNMEEIFNIFRSVCDQVKDF